MGITDDLLYDIAKLYYLDNLNQSEISKQFGLSRAKVSRLLAKARERDIVTISLNRRNDDDVDLLTDKIKEAFDLKNVLVVPSSSYDANENLKSVAKAAAPFFTSFIKDGDKIGISWGYTLLEIAKSIPPSSFASTSIVQIAGNLDNADNTNYAYEILHQFGQKLGVSSQVTLPCPVIVESKIIVDLLSHDSKISSVLSQINQIDIAFINIGLLSDDNCLHHTGYISSEDLEKLRSKNAVGAVCSRFIDIDGNIVDNSYDERTICVTFPVLKKARISCVAISSDQKIPPLVGAIRAGTVNTLAIDTHTAKALLQYSK